MKKFYFRCFMCDASFDKLGCEPIKIIPADNFDEAIVFLKNYINECGGNAEEYRYITNAEKITFNKRIIVLKSSSKPCKVENKIEKMTRKEIINGLKFMVDMFLFDSSTGETFSEPRNNMDKIPVDACKGAIELLEQTQWIPVSERLPEVGEDVLVWYEYFRYGEYNCMYQTYGIGCQYGGRWGGSVCGKNARCIAWQPLPESYKAESE